jgi:NAD(P)-dependent dehydrogenase (short-subunit alcohol dehydrogenase family)
MSFTLFQELSRSLESETGKLYPVKCDISNESEVLAAFKWVKDNLGGVDILINNAAVSTDTSVTGKWPKHYKKQVKLALRFHHPCIVGLGALHKQSVVPIQPASCALRSFIPIR